MGGMGDTNAPPTEWALTMRKWVICLWLLLLGCFIGKLVVLDLFGAFSMLIVVALGYFVPFGKPAMQQRWIIFWGIMCAFNCIIDLIFGVMHLIQFLNGSYTAMGAMGGGHHQHGGAIADPNRKPTPMETYMIKVALPAVIIGLVVPFVELIIAYACYKLYQDHPRSASDSGSDPYGSSSGGYGGTSNGGGSAYNQGGRPVGGGGQRPGGGGNSFQAFGGSGQRLGGGQ